jgi:hypothetical protein
MQTLTDTPTMFTDATISCLHGLVGDERPWSTGKALVRRRAR